MREGLKIVRLPGGRYGYPLTFIGWLKRRSGDEYDLLNARAIQLTAEFRLDGLQRLALHGKENRYKLGPMGPSSGDGVIEVNRLHVFLPITANEEAWKKDCPKPKGWDESMR